MAKRRIKLIHLFQLISIVTLITLAIVTAAFNIYTDTAKLKQRSENLRDDYINQQKTLIKREVMRAVALIDEQRSHAEEETRAVVRERTEEAITIAENIYQQNRAVKSEAEIKQMIVDALRPIRFANGAGYYFVTRLDGYQVLFADKPELEGTSLLKVKDTNGQFVVKDTIAIANSSGEGFYEYHWTKPGVAGKQHKKVAYIKLFKPFSWLIGTGAYVEDTDLRIKRELLRTLSTIRFGDNGYIFVNHFNGDALCTSGKIVSGNRKLWQVIGRNPEPTKALFAKEYETALKPDGDYINYTWNKLTEPDQEFPKVSFVYGFPELQWLIGAGVYLDEIESHISGLRAQFRKYQYTQIKVTLLVTGGLIGLVLFLFYLVSNRLKKDLDLCVENFSDVAHKDRKICKDQIYFEELSLLAEHVNAVLQDKKNALEEMRLSEEKYRNIFDAAMVGLFRSRLSDGLYLEANEKASGMFGSSNEEVIGKVKAIDLFQDLSQRQRLLSELEKKGQVDGFEVDFILPNGQPANFSISVKAYPDKGYMEGISIDITERKRAEKLLAESELRFRELADLLPVVAYELDIENEIIYANQSAYRLFGYTKDDLARGVNAVEMFAPDEQQRLRDNIAALYRGDEVGGVEYLALKKDGSTFPILATSSLIVKDGKISGQRGVIVDLSERKQAEEEILKLRKLESLGVLAGGIAHDFNNILAAILGNISLALTTTDPKCEIYELLVESEKASLRAQALTQQLLTFSKGGEPVKKVAAINEVIKDSANFVLRGSNIRSVFNVSEDLWPVAIDSGQISQVVQNIVINASQAMPSGGTIEIDCINYKFTSGKSISDKMVSLKPGDYVKIIIKDQGVGIAPELLEKVFDPYFTTKQKGSGLGLAITYSIIRKHEGYITVESEMGQGTTFTIYLPASIDRLELDQKDVTEPPPTGHGRVMIMDDEEMIRSLVEKFLSRIGYEVASAKDGAEAVRLYQESKVAGAPIDLIIMDLTVPGGMGGKDTIKEIHKIDSAAKVLVSSGYSNDPVMANFSEYGFCGALVKPFQMRELREIVGKAMSS